MDAEVWKLVVEKAILRTKSRDLLWSRSSEGPDRSKSFQAPIDGSTTLNIWGHESGYSYEMCLIRETGGEPFTEKKRVTTKNSSEGIDYSGLFKAVQRQIPDIARERCFDAIIEYMADPAVDPERYDDFIDRWWGIGHYGFLTIEQWDKILCLVKNMTSSEGIDWSVDQDGDEEVSYSADLGELLQFSLRPSQARGRVAGTYSYSFHIDGSGDQDFCVSLEQDPGNARIRRPLWSKLDELHGIVLRQCLEEKLKFNKIVRDDIIHDILASLDAPSKDRSTVDGL
jgi:hypothetical protein